MPKRSSEIALGLYGAAAVFGPVLGIAPIAAPVEGIGLLLFTVGAFIRYRAIYELGDMFSPSVVPNPEHRMVTTGLYRYVKHPSYWGMVIAGIGWSLFFKSWFGIGCEIVMLPFLLARMRTEDALLANAHPRPTAAAQRAGRDMESDP